MGKQAVKTVEELEEELNELRHQLYEANETIEAIRTGQIDALVVEGENGNELYTLRTADHAYRVFIEKMAQGAVTLNRSGEIQYSNSQFAAMTGQPVSSIIGVPFQNFIIPSLRARFKDLFDHCWTSDCQEETILADDGSPIPVQLSLTALELQDGISLSIIITNLTIQKKNQLLLEENNQKLETMNQALELSNHDLQQLASVASHDLQEPLRKIQMFSNLLRDSSRSSAAEQEKYIGKIIDSAGRMKNLIVDVLNYSKLSARDNTFEKVDLNNVLKELIDDFDLLIHEKNAEVMMGNLPVIMANYGQMRQVFQNIISNALKFARRDNSPVIRIVCKTLAEKSFDSQELESGPYSLISVKDNGIGFDEKYLGLIFALFERLHSKDAYEGTGIGLAITKKIVEKHHGLVTARSHAGEGAEFLILLPVNQN